MSSERSFLERIAAKPEDVSARLAYADWLEDRSDPRGEFIRIHEQYRELRNDDPQRRELERKKLEFLDSGKIVPLEANCTELPDDDELEVTVAKLGVPLPWREDCWASPELARLTCQPFDFTNSIGMRLSLLPAGMFVMGDDIEDATRHRVRLTTAFHLGMYQVTQHEYEEIVGQNPSVFNGRSEVAEYVALPTKEEMDGNRQRLVAGRDTTRYPVENISWNESVAFCGSLARLEGQAYRLPTEAEWEYACRAGTSTNFFFGDDVDQLTNYAVFDTGLPEPVGCKQPNNWDLFGMLGNVGEWCKDWNADYEASDVMAKDPAGPAVGQRCLLGECRVTRGGSWLCFEEECGPAVRGAEPPYKKSSDLGFRVARVPSSVCS